MTSLDRFLQFEILNIGEYKIRVFTLVVVFAIFVITRLVLWVIKKAMFRENRFDNHDYGNVVAVFQIIKYVVWVVAVGLVFDAVGIKLTVLLAGSAALLVGVGLGLQQTFNDIISGIILLSERSIKVDDILEIDGDVVKIQKIGLRTSTGLNRDEISIIIPNSLITTNKVINWSHQAKKTRFRISVGVAYGSDVEHVLQILEESVIEHPEVDDKKTVQARFVEFNNSSLDFQVLFYSENVFRIEKMKSEIRKIINRKFLENNITIPFPQMDVYIKSNERKES